MKAIIFDMDGVLLDTEVEYIRRFDKLITSFGLPFSDEMANSIIGSSIKNTELILTDFLKEVISMEDFWGLWQKELVENPIDAYKLRVPYMKDVLSDLKKKGYKLALASSTVKDRIISSLKDAKILQYFDVILSGQDLEKSKPDPMIYNTCMNILNLDKEDCIVVEDSYYGIEAGKRAGCLVIAREVDKYKIDQSKADFIIRDAREIISIIERIEGV